LLRPAPIAPGGTPMLTGGSIVMRIPSAYPPRAVLRIHRSLSGRRCAMSGDVMIGGPVFDREAAIRFIRRESGGAPRRLVDGEELSAVAA
jgi:hypothetical protein